MNGVNPIVIQSVAIGIIFMHLVAMVTGLIVLFLAAIISDPFLVVASSLLIGSSILGIWFSLKFWKAPYTVFGLQVGSISKKMEVKE